MRVQQEKVAAMVESIAKTSECIDCRILDALSLEETTDNILLRSFLNSLEMLGSHWRIVIKEKYAHRLALYDQIDSFINEIPRVTNQGNLFNIKTFVLSCKTPYMSTKNGMKVFINKEYSNSAGKLHLLLYGLLSFLDKTLSPCLNQINEELNQSGVMQFLKTVFFSDPNDLNHPLFKDSGILGELEGWLRRLDRAIRNFEITYIAMIQDL